jgi:hypothetical protein
MLQAENSPPMIHFSNGRSLTCVNISNLKLVTIVSA